MSTSLNGQLMDDDGGIWVVSLSKVYPGDAEMEELEKGLPRFAENDVLEAVKQIFSEYGTEEGGSSRNTQTVNLCKMLDSVSVGEEVNMEPVSSSTTASKSKRNEKGEKLNQPLMTPESQKSEEPQQNKEELQLVPVQQPQLSVQDGPNEEQVISNTMEVIPYSGQPHESPNGPAPEHFILPDPHRSATTGTVNLNTNQRPRSKGKSLSTLRLMQKLNLQTCISQIRIEAGSLPRNKRMPSSTGAMARPPPSRPTKRPVFMNKHQVERFPTTTTATTTMYATPKKLEFRCPNSECPKTYSCKNGLKYHLQHHHLTPEQEEERKKKVQNPRYACGHPLCEKRYQNKSGLSYHLRTFDHKKLQVEIKDEVKNEVEVPEQAETAAGAFDHGLF